MKNLTKIFTAIAGAAFCAMIMTVPAKAATAEDAANQARWAKDQELHAQVVAQQVANYEAANAANQARWAKDQELHAQVVAQQVANKAKADADNYAFYLSKVVVNKKETERIKKEIVTNYTELAKVNPAFNNLIPAANADYLKAVADTQAAQEAADAAKAAAAAMK